MTYRSSLLMGEEGHEGGTGRKAGRRKGAKRKIPIDRELPEHVSIDCQMDVFHTTVCS